MGDSLQDVYARNLPKHYGYPLRTPEPSTTLPESYQNDGLQVGDVGYVDDYGRFQVLFNIHHSSQHELHRKRGVPADFEPLEFDPEEVDIVRNAIPAKQVVRPSHLKQQVQLSEERVQYEFVTSSTGAGAILILPFGAARHDLKEKDDYRKLAAEQAHRWCTFARRNSLYLLTGFHKTRSWSLASFHGAERAGRIRVIRRVGEHDNVTMYDWEHTFPLERRDGPVVRHEADGNENQTVFISGFKIAVRWWARHPMIVWVPESEGVWFVLYVHLSWFLGVLFGLAIIVWRRFTVKSLEHVPMLSQPFHPSDAINRYLLEKNPNADVAVTHDSQWIDMLDREELSYDDLAQDGRLWQVLSEKYTCSSDTDNVVYLRVKTPDREDCDTGELSDCLQEFKGFYIRRKSSMRVVITHIRAENIAIAPGYIPAGFNVLVHADSIGRRTKTVPVLLQENVIEWDDEFLIPSDPIVKVQFSVCACFEFDPMLGHGEVLHTCEISPEQLVGNTYLITFPPKVTGLSPSLLLTLERRHFDYPGAESYSDSELQSAALSKATDNGHDALLRYYRGCKREDLESSVEQFERAIRLCSEGDDYRTPALFNLATARFTNSRVFGTRSDLTTAISLFREVLESRSLHHPDRPATLLQLAQALLYGYKVQEFEESMVGEIEQLVSEIRKICHEDSHERRAADLVLQTLKRFRIVHSPSPVDLDNLISVLDRSFRAPPADYFDRPERLENLRVALLARSELRHDSGDADRAIGILEEAVKLTSNDHIDKPTYLINLGNSLLARFNIFGNGADLERAIAQHEDGVRLTPEHHPDVANHLCDLGISLCARFKQFGDVQDINSAVEKQECAMTLTPDGHFDYPERLHNLGLSLKARFERLAELPDIDSAIEKQERAVRLTAEHHPQLSTRLSNLAASLKLRYEHLGRRNDIDSAISRQEDAEQVTPEGHPKRAGLLADLASYLKARFALLGDRRDIEQAIAKYEESLEITPQDHSLRSRRLHGLGISHNARFDRFGDLDDLEVAIARLEEAVRFTPQDSTHRAPHLNSLGLALCSRFNRLGDLTDLEQAIARQQEAVELIPNDHPNYPRYLNDFARSKWTRFKRLGDLADIQRAIEMQEEAVKVTPQHDGKYATFLSHLGLSYLARFGHAGDMHDLGLAVEKQEEALQLTPDDHPTRPRHLNSLGFTSWARFCRLGDADDIERAINFQEDAIRLTPSDHPDHSFYRNDLALSLRARFDRLGEISHLDQAIVTWEDILSLTPRNHPIRALFLSNLGPSLHARFSRAGNREDLDRAIEMEKDAMVSTPNDHPDRPRLLNNLAHALMTRFETARDNNAADLDNAIQIQQEVVALTPERNPYRALFVSNLGYFFKIRFQRLLELKDLDQAIENVQDALDLTMSDDPEYEHRAEDLRILRRARST